MKSVQTDLFCLLFGLLALTAALLSLCEANPATWAGISVVLGFLCGQEKLGGGLILILCTAVFFFALLRDSRFLSGQGRQLRTGAAILVCAGAILLCAAAHYGFTLLDPRLQVARPLWGAFDAATTWADVTKKLYHFGEAGSVELFLPLVSFVVAVLGCVGLGMLCARLSGRSLRRLTLFSLGTTVVAFPVGTLYFTAVAPKLSIALAPMIPVAPGHFIPPRNFNQVTQHFGAVTALGHYLLGIQAQFATFFCALPLSLVLGLTAAAGVWGIRLWTMPLGDRKRERPAACLALAPLLALLVPVGCALANIQVNCRYQNFALLVPALGTAMLFYAVSPLWKKYLPALALAFCCGLILELLPYAPTFMGYRSPLVNITRCDFAQELIPGRLSPFWNGWGEETTLAARLLDQTSDGKPVNLFTYGTIWLHPATNVHVYPASAWRFIPSINKTDRDYLLFIRLHGIQNHAADWYPHKTKPVAVVQDRGFVTGWLFRCDMLAKNGELPPLLLQDQKTDPTSPPLFFDPGTFPVTYVRLPVVPTPDGWAPAEDVPSPPYALPYTVAGMMLARICGTGWNPAEVSGAWTAAPVAELAVPLAAQPQGNVDVTLDCGFLGIPGANRNLRITAGGQILFDAHFPDAVTYQRVNVRVPASTLGNDGTLRLTVESQPRVHEALDPASHDPRSLGVFVGKMRVVLEQ